MTKLLRRTAMIGLTAGAAAEAGAAWWHLQKSSDSGSALVWVAQRSLARLQAWREQRAIAASLAGVSPEQYVAAVFARHPDPAARAVRDELANRYHTTVMALAQELRVRGIQILLFYPPVATGARGRGRAVFSNLAQALGQSLIEPTTMATHRPDEVYLQPLDDHPSRFGHGLMAAALAGSLRPVAQHRAPTLPSGAPPARLGDLEQGSDEILRTVPAYPFRLGANTQGLRMTDLVPPNSDRQVVLCLGDSFTFGTPLAAADAYPGQLARGFPERLIVNAGVGGYGILHQASLFRQFWAGVRVDVVILQMLDTNIEQLLWFFPPKPSRPLPRRDPTDAEARLRDYLRDR